MYCELFQKLKKIPQTLNYKYQYKHDGTFKALSIYSVATAMFILF